MNICLLLNFSDQFVPANDVSLADVCTLVYRQMAALKTLNYGVLTPSNRCTYTPNGPLALAETRLGITLLLLSATSSTPAIQLHAVKADKKTMSTYWQARAADRTWSQGVPNSNFPDDSKVTRKAMRNAKLCADLRLLYRYSEPEPVSATLPKWLQLTPNRLHDEARAVRRGVPVAIENHAEERIARDCGLFVIKPVRSRFSSLYCESKFHQGVKRVARYASGVFFWGHRSRTQTRRGRHGIQGGRAQSNEAFARAV